MEFASLTDASIRSSRLILGCGRLGSTLSPLGSRERMDYLSQAFADGINHFDTADIHGDSEPMLAAAFALHRHEIVLATKAGQRLSPKQKVLAPFTGPLRIAARHSAGLATRFLREKGRRLPPCFAPDYLRAAIERSLRRLRTDYIDLFYLHGPSPEVLDDGGVLFALEQAVRAGKLRAWGVSADDAATVAAAVSNPDIQLIQADFRTLQPFAAAAWRMGEKTFIARGLTALPSFQAGHHGNAMREILSLPAVAAVVTRTVSPHHLAQNILAVQEASRPGV